MAKLREQLKTKATFYSEKVMSSRIYGKKREDSDGKSKKPSRQVHPKSVGKGSASGKRQKRDSVGKSGESSKKLKK